MQGESAVIPVTETTGASRTSLHVRYLRLLRANANFRRLWLAQLISERSSRFAHQLFDLNRRERG